MMNNVMIDLESFGQEPGNVILTISAVQFDIETGRLGRIYKNEIDLNSSLKWGLTIDPSTVMWWMKQSTEARKRIVESQEIGSDLKDVLDGFYKWFANLPADENNLFDRDEIIVWGRGPRFDMGLLAYAYRLVGYKRTPWDFRKEKCVRTYESIAPHIKKQFDKERTTILHDGEEDAKHQIKYVVAIEQLLRMAGKSILND